MIFISYRISDSEDLVSRLDHDLTLEFGQNSVFRDKSRLEGGVVWPEVLETNAKCRKVMLVVIGNLWQSVVATDGDWKGIPRLMNPDDWVRKELTFAFDTGNIVIPVLRNGAQMPTQGWLKNCQLERLYQQQAIEIRSSQYSADLSTLVTRLRSLLPDLPSPTPLEPTTIIYTRPLPPAPPEYFAEVEYILTDTFIGRASELTLLDDWAKSSNPCMVVEGLGGLGKSALTWEWFQKRARNSIPNLAGRAWCDIYGPSASLLGSLRNIFAYIFREYPPLEFSILELSKSILQELKSRPYLIVFDGFERILIAYHRWDKAQQRDGQIDSDKRACVDPRDADVLKQFLNCSPSKVLISTRLFPTALEDRTGRHSRGVAHHHLYGLSRADTLAYFCHIGIRGNESKMLDFAKKFGNHSLVLKVICGEICNYFRKPGDFDFWLNDPEHGGKIKLSEMDLKQNYTHILEFALKGLDEPKQKLLSRLAILSEHLDYDTVFIINPYLPERPAGMSLQDFVQSKPVQDSRQQFEKALRELADRGLVQWDRQTGHFDMHPVVRGHAADLIPEADRHTTFLTVRDHFQALPAEDFEEASELSQVRHTIEIYRSCLGAGLWDEAAAFFFKKEEFANTLLFRIGAFPLIEELLKPLLETDSSGQPRLTEPIFRANVLNTLAIALSGLGRDAQSLGMYEQSLRTEIDHKNWSNAGIMIKNWAKKKHELGQLVVASAAIMIAKEISTRVEDDDGITGSILDQAWTAIVSGRFDEGDQLLREFHSRPVPSYSTYRPGDAEHWHCFNQFQQGKWNVEEWNQALEVSIGSKNVLQVHRLLALRGNWFFRQGWPQDALNDFDEALKIANRMGMYVPEYHDLRGWVLASIGRREEAVEELEQGQQREVAGWAWRCLNEPEKAQECAMNGYRHAWGEGPPYIHSYCLEQSRTLLRELGVPEPQLPAFDASQVPPIPFEAELRELLPTIKSNPALLVYLVTAKAQGRPAWYYIQVKREKLADYKKQLKKGSLNLADFGDILESGWGEYPPEPIMYLMDEKYGAVHN